MAGGAGNDTHYGFGGAERIVFDGPGWGIDLVNVSDRAAGAKLGLRGSGVTAFVLLSVVSRDKTRIAAPDGPVIDAVSATGFTAADFLFA